MSAVDTSVVVPALTRWHEAHDVSRRASAGQSIPFHALVESYAVLARLPTPHRLSAQLAEELLGAWFPRERVLEPPGPVAGGFLARIRDAGSLS